MQFYRQLILKFLVSSLSLMLSLSVTAASQGVSYLEQNWSDEERQYFYFADQATA